MAQQELILTLNQTMVMTLCDCSSSVRKRIGLRCQRRRDQESGEPNHAG